MGELCEKRINLGEIFCLARFVDRLLVYRPTKESFATLTSLKMDDWYWSGWQMYSRLKSGKKSEFIPWSWTFSDILTLFSDILTLWDNLDIVVEAGGLVRAHHAQLLALCNLGFRFLENLAEILILQPSFSSLNWAPLWRQQDCSGDGGLSMRKSWIKQGT